MELAQHEIQAVLSTPFQELCYIVRLRDSEQCVVIDPGLDPERIVEQLESEQLEPVAILNTHGHCDHIGGNRLLKDRFPAAKLIIGRRDAHMLADAAANGSRMFGQSVVSPAAEQELAGGEQLELAGMPIRVLSVPGHSAGHVAYLIENTVPLLFAGDVLFAGSIGRTDLPGGNYKQLVDSIRSQLLTLPDKTIVFPGHGPITTIGQERASNPWLTGL